MKSESNPPSHDIDSYQAYIETELSCMAQEMDELKAAAAILLMKLNMNTQTIRDGKLLAEIIQRKPFTADCEKLIKEWY
jgi:hypothetical protein